MFYGIQKNMPNTLVKRVTFGLSSPLLPMLLIRLLSVPAHAQTQTAFFKKPVEGEALIDAIHWAMGGSGR